MTAPARAAFVDARLGCAVGRCVVAVAYKTTGHSALFPVRADERKLSSSAASSAPPLRKEIVSVRITER